MHSCGRECVEHMSDPLPRGFDGPLGCFSQECLSFAKTCSIRLRWGLYGGRLSTEAPLDALRARRAGNHRQSNEPPTRNVSDVVKDMIRFSAGMRKLRKKYGAGALGSLMRSQVIVRRKFSDIGSRDSSTDLADLPTRSSGSRDCRPPTGTLYNQRPADRLRRSCANGIALLIHEMAKKAVKYDVLWINEAVRVGRSHV